MCDVAGSVQHRPVTANLAFASTLEAGNSCAVSLSQHALGVWDDVPGSRGRVPTTANHAPALLAQIRWQHNPKLALNPEP